MEKLRCKFLARKSAKLIANFSATIKGDVTSVCLSLSLSVSLSLCISLYLSLSLSLSLCISLSLSLSLSLYLSLSPSAPSAQYRKRFRASYNTSTLPNWWNRSEVALQLSTRTESEVSSGQLIILSEPFNSTKGVPHGSVLMPVHVVGTLTSLTQTTEFMKIRQGESKNWTEKNKEITKGSLWYGT